MSGVAKFLVALVLGSAAIGTVTYILDTPFWVSVALGIPLGVLIEPLLRSKP